MNCPRCKNHILQKSGNKIRLRTTGQIVFEDGVCKSKCYWCKEDIEIPMEITESIPVARERYVINKKP